MALQVAGKTIKRITIVDDDPGARESYEYILEDLHVQSVKETGPLDDMGKFLKRMMKQSNALLCDYHLKKKPYAVFDGDELVEQCYKARFPAILCTSYTDYDLTLMRSRRRFVPTLLKPNNLDPGAIVNAFERCIKEFKGEFLPSRKPWRTLVRVEEVEFDEKYFYAVVPGWNPRKKIRLYFDDLPQEMQHLIRPGKRFHAQVNVGAKSEEELYFDAWESE